MTSHDDSILTGLAQALANHTGKPIAIEPAGIRAEPERRPVATAKPTYYSATIEVLPAGERRFLIKSGDGTGHSYALERALGRLIRRVGATVERTGFGKTVYLQLPQFSKATGAECSSLTAQNLADFIASK